MLLVLSKTAAVLVLALAGAVSRRRGLLDQASCAVLSRLVVDVTFPALVLAQLVRSVDHAALAGSWPLPLLGAAVLLLGAACAWVTTPLFCPTPALRRTYVFCTSLANWIFLPLLITAALFGAAGVRAVLLINVGALVTLWTAGVWLLSRGAGDRDGCAAAPSLPAALLANPGLLATMAGVVLALALPQLAGVHAADPATLSVPLFLAHVLLFALELLGRVTVPLSVFVTGGQLGGVPAAALRPDRALAGVLLGRLLLVPTLLIAIGVAGARLGLRLEAVDEAVSVIVAAMPVAVTSSLFVQRFGGSVELAARSVVYSLLAATLSAPTVYGVYARLVG